MMNNVNRIKVSLPHANTIINGDKVIKKGAFKHFKKETNKRIHYPLNSSTIICDPSDNKTDKWFDYKAIIPLNVTSGLAYRSAISPQNERQYSTFLPQNLPLKARRNSNSRSATRNMSNYNSISRNIREVGSPLTNSRIVSWT